ncbi:MAG: ABC transporter substrate-binding protein [archaeon]
MKKNNLLVIGIVLAFVLIILLVSLKINGYLILKDNKEIVIGSIMPFTGDGAVYGIEAKKASDLAVEEINSNGGVNGKKLRIIYEDSKCNSSDALTSINKLINIDNTSVILGGICSSENLGASPVAESNKVIMFSPISTSPKITLAGDYIFRNIPSDAFSAREIAKDAMKKNYKVAILYEKAEYSQALISVFENNFKGNIVAKEAFASEDNDFKSQITKILSKNPDAVYLATSTPKKLAQALKQLREFGFTKQLYSTEFATSSDIVDSYKEEIEGTIIAEPRFDSGLSNTKIFLDKMKAKYNKFDIPEFYLATTYDAVYILKEAIENCGSKNTECIKKNLYSIKDRKGVAGSLTIDPNGDSISEFSLKIIKDGKSIDYS